MATATAKTLNHFFEDWLGAEAGSEQKLLRLVENGLPTRVINHLMERGLTRNEVFGTIIPLRTWKHRKSRREPLSREESERAIRTAKILARAQAVLGDEAAALDWLRTPKRRFEGRPPIQMLSTEAGGRLVEQMLIQIDQGMFA
jgi:putative toxin-antitoxin system antitoxin component (TIGR02293 family)